MNETLLEYVRELMTLDPGNRGLLGALPPQDLRGAVRLLQGCRHALIVTGFSIASAGVGETDGPIGAAAVARALTLAGRICSLVTDRYSADLVSACLAAVGADCPVHVLDVETGDAAALAKALAPDLIIAIERPGKGRDGHFHNMRGAVIDSMTDDTDPLLTLGIPVIAVGDGGNELGMGNHLALIEHHVAEGARIAAVKCSDVPLVAGVSNWWGWGLAALLSLAEGRDLLTDRETELRSLRACMEAGGVDGVTGAPAMSVDGIALGGIDEIHGPLKALTGKNDHKLSL